MRGRFCRLEPLSAERHADSLFDANALDREERMWTYLLRGPYGSRAEYRAYLEKCSASEDPLFFAIVDAGLERATGLGSYLRIEPAHGVIEVGHLAFSPLLQRTAAATEALYLMMRQVFELGYRRYEWKCDALNARSCRAAERLGFTFEGIFRQAVVYKGRNRDTAWYAIIDSDWPAIDAEFRRWLAPITSIQEVSSVRRFRTAFRRRAGRPRDRRRSDSRARSAAEECATAAAARLPRR
jgi:RimJ/RimL family protein N-acetyltransferase